MSLLDVPGNATLKHLLHNLWSDRLFGEVEVIDGVDAFMRIVGLEYLQFEQSDEPHGE
jgi:hypothetical protein